MQRTCVRCDHTNQAATGSDTEACPKCGAIYSKARPAQASGFGASSSFGGTKGGRQSAKLPEHYVQSMRQETLYPAFRVVTNLCHWVLLALALIVAVLSLVGGFASGPQVALGGLAVALLVAVASKVLKEGSNMIADMADAAVRTAAARSE